MGKISTFLSKINPFGASVEAPAPKRDFFDSDNALTSFENMKVGGVNSALASPTGLVQLRNRSRSELRNSPLAKGLPETYANFTIGRGPRKFTVVSDDKSWNDQAENIFTRWSEACGINGESMGRLLHPGTKEFFPAGEFFLAPVMKRGKMRELLPRIRFIPIVGERISDPLSSFSVKNNPAIKMGVKVGDNGETLGYYVKEKDPDLFSTVSKSKFISADQMIHVFRTEIPGQVRGEPWMSTSSNTFNKVRQYDKSILALLEVAANWNVFIKNMSESAASGDTIEPGKIDIQQGMNYMLDPGYEPDTVSANSPSDTHLKFRENLHADASASMQIPKNLATKDSSDSNFASARFDGTTFLLAVETTQQLIEEDCIKKMFDMVIDEAIAMQIIPQRPLRGIRLKTLWAKSEFFADPAKVAKANEVALKNGWTTITEIRGKAGEVGGTDFVDALAAEVELYKEKGLVHPIQRDNSGETDVEQEETEPQKATKNND